ncbi:MAG TPA: glycosyltransferase [Allosphingosinicella sp.]|nr:glycosyltransferase [Allosphingosinicella sp.]
MLRVLTLSTLFPNAAQPTFGVFVERQTLGLAARDDVELEVVAARRLPVWPLVLHPRYRDKAGLPERETWKGVTVHRPRFRGWPLIGGSGMARAQAHALLPLLRKLRERFAFDVIDAEFFWPDGPAAMHLASALGVPFSIKARGSDIDCWSHMPAVARQILAAGLAADGLLAVSDVLKSHMVELGLPADKIRVHHTGVEERFRPVDRAAAKASFGVEGPVIAFVGHLIELKGPLLALAALEDIPGATLIMIGEGAQRRQLERVALEKGLGDRLRLLGTRPHEELPGLLAMADVMVLPSQREGLANAWVEAVACGTPVVTTDVGGARDVIDRPAAGRIVARRPEAIAAAVREILADPPDPLEVRKAAEKFSWQRNADELFTHLAGLAARAPAGR